MRLLLAQSAPMMTTSGSKAFMNEAMATPMKIDLSHIVLA
jgi:hypothetical protein